MVLHSKVGETWVDGMGNSWWITSMVGEFGTMFRFGCVEAWKVITVFSFPGLGVVFLFLLASTTAREFEEFMRGVFLGAFFFVENISRAFNFGSKRCRAFFSLFFWHLIGS